MKFNYTIGVWEGAIFELPWLGDDYVLLTPEDILTKDDTWINKEDLRRDFRTQGANVLEAHTLPHAAALAIEELPAEADA